MRIYERPFSAIKQDGKNIKYFDFINSLQNEDCNNALKRIYPKIDMEKINAIIEDTPAISDMQKRFYKMMLEGRREIILQQAYEKLMKL